jgi:hypothetical protein
MVMTSLPSLESSHHFGFVSGSSASHHDLAGKHN